MSKKEHSPIKLQLEEAIWLDHRAQGAEIISLELFPDVDIVTDELFVNIRGHLVLNGRYETELGEGSLDLESSSLAEQLQFDPLHVEPKELYEQEYNGKIEHRFPFDVTVPANKISNLDDVYVQVEEFDYSITDGHRLYIKTDILISGIADLAEEETVAEPSRGEEKNKDVEESGTEIGKNEAETESRLAKESEIKDSKTEGLESKVEDRSAAEKSDTEVESRAREKIGEEVEDSELEKENRSEENRIEENKPVENQTEENLASSHAQEIKTTFKSSSEEDESRPESQESVLQEELESKESTERVELENGDSQAEERSSTVSFLTQLMEFGAEDEQEERMSQVRMCIIQQGESLEDIAQRYSMSVTDIMKANQLSSEKTSKGQILYIP